MTINSELGLTSSIGTYLRLGASKHEEKESPERIHERDLFFKISNCEHKKVTLRNGVNGECGCIKCGLRDSLWREKKYPEFLTKDDFIMLDYLRRFERCVIGEDTGITCDLNQAMEIYAILRDENKGATEDMVISEFIKSMKKLQEEELKLGLKNKKHGRI